MRFITGFVLRRVVIVASMLLAVSFLIFMAFTFVPGDPAQQLLGHFWTPQAGEELRKKLGLDDPRLVQYARYLQNALKGDLGRSYMTKLPVLSQVAKAYFASLQLAGVAISLSLSVALPLGLLTAVRRNSWFDKAWRFITVLLSSIPIFVLGIVAIYIFAAKLHLLPSGGRGTIYHFVLPGFILSLFSTAGILRMTRATALEVLKQDYIRSARARGLSPSKIITNHVLRNTGLPLITVVGLYVGMMVATAIITEYIFAWPGLGSLTITAIQSRDIPLAQGGILAIAFTYLVINSLVDILYGVLDPRIRTRSMR